MEEVHPNLEQMLSLHPEFNAPIAEHDRRLAPLAEACRRLQEALIGSQALRETLHGIETIPSSDTEFCLRLIAEYIINGAQNLSDYYTLARIWNEHRKDFMSAVETPEVSPSWQATIGAAGAFATAVHELIGKLKAFRNELSLSNGVPIVDRLTGPI